jgi:NADH:ubiquinone oxidoreductase subunit K
MCNGIITIFSSIAIICVSVIIVVVGCSACRAHSAGVLFILVIRVAKAHTRFFDGLRKCLYSCSRKVGTDKAALCAAIVTRSRFDSVERKGSIGSKTFGCSHVPISIICFHATSVIIVISFVWTPSEICILGREGRFVLVLEDDDVGK